mgnify:CR=1 FL=1
MQLNNQECNPATDGLKQSVAEIKPYTAETNLNILRSSTIRGPI